MQKPYLELLCLLVKPKMGPLLDLPARVTGKGQISCRDSVKGLRMLRQLNYQNRPLKSVPSPRDSGCPCTDVLGEMAMLLWTNANFNFTKNDSIRRGQIS